mmetsp:Transcript_108545/g.346459  ORF Transcript_108545/g.346459 Transcript_108545/m.346459 type:complete len:214 (+) Transcript_108545:408-1049(+)
MRQRPQRCRRWRRCSRRRVRCRACRLRGAPLRRTDRKQRRSWSVTPTPRRLPPSLHRWRQLCLRCCRRSIRQPRSSPAAPPRMPRSAPPLSAAALSGTSHRRCWCSPRRCVRPPCRPPLPCRLRSRRRLLLARSTARSSWSASSPGPSTWRPCSRSCGGRRCGPPGGRRCSSAGPTRRSSSQGSSRTRPCATSSRAAIARSSGTKSPGLPHRR